MTTHPVPVAQGNGPHRGFRSLTTRLIVWILLLGGGAAALALILSNRVSRQSAVQAAEREALRATDAAVNRAEGRLHSIEEASRVLAAALESARLTEGDLAALLQRFVAGNPHVYGSAAAFAPRAFDAARERFAPYWHRAREDRGRLRRADLAAPGYRYWERDWYAEPARTGAPRWSEPYFDSDGGEVTMVTYSVPVFGNDPSRSLRAVVTADVDLEWLGRLARDFRVGRSGFAVLLSREGRVLAHPALAGVGTSTLEAMEPALRSRVAPLVERMRSGHKGFEPLRLPDGDHRVMYAPMAGTGWSLAAVYPERELLEPAQRLRNLQLALSAFGLLALALVVVALSRGLTAPLRELGSKARELATGDLDVALPEVRSRDEIGALTAAFHHMRDSLKAHIRELQEATAARERLESELRLARRIQMGLLPENEAGGPEHAYALSACLVPARAVGGDLFDHLERDGKLCFLVADVSGKGIPAALFMARTKTLFEAVASVQADPAAILVSINDGLLRENEEGMYVTGVCGILELGSGSVSLAVAGHDPPLLVRSGQPVAPLQLDGGPVLGLMPGAAFPINRFELRAGDELVAYTDGVPDARDEGDNFFGPERLLQAVAVAAPRGVRAVTDGLLESVQTFAGGAPQADDITILALQYQAPPDRSA